MSGSERGASLARNGTGWRASSSESFIGGTTLITVTYTIGKTKKTLLHRLSHQWEDSVKTGRPPPYLIFQVELWEKGGLNLGWGGSEEEQATF